MGMILNNAKAFLLLTISTTMPGAPPRIVVQL